MILPHLSMIGMMPACITSSMIHRCRPLSAATGQQHRDLLQRYLEQVGFFAHQRVALVDIGWNGTVQKFLKQAFGQRADFPLLHGYYFAFVPKMYADFGDNNVCEGIIHDSRRGNACERIPAEFEEIFEQGARSHEATTIAYREEDGRVVPVLKADDAPDRQAELACNPSGGADAGRGFCIIGNISALFSN